jgi:hypothetical protein
MGVDKTIIFILYFSCNIFIYATYIYFAFIKRTLKFKNLKVNKSNDSNICLDKEEKEKLRNTIYKIKVKTGDINIDKEENVKM